MNKAVRAAGLVGQVTTVTRTLPCLGIREALRGLNQQRRVRRMRRVVIAAADATRDLPGFRSRGILVTLTYREREPWRSEDVTQYVRAVREFLRRRGVMCRYQWVLELTKRGRPHYHVLFWVPPSVRLPKPDTSGQWKHGLTRIEKARRPVGYLVKYATKGGVEDGTLPYGARLFGVGAPDKSVRLARHRAGLPAWLAASSDPDEWLSRVTRVGWVERSSGLVHVTPFDTIFFRDSFGFVVVVVQQKEAKQ